MEMNESPSWLNTGHPNFERWEKAREISMERGKFVELIISRFIKCERLNILELGSGEGGTALIFSKQNIFISLDLSLLRLQRQPESIIRINADALRLPFKHSTFDLIILQDVIEHLPYNDGLLHYLSGFLKKEGIIFLSTPNRFSFLNIISDPHFGLPFLSLFKRDQIKKYFLSFLRKEDSERKDIAQLLSLKELKRMSYDYEIILNTKFSVSELFKENKGIIWSKFHLTLTKIILWTGLYKLIIKIANDRESFLNQYLTPTFYLILKRK
jgi:SAM-dependent methyltransferase